MFLGLDVGGTRCRWEWSPASTSPGGEAPGLQPAVLGIEAATDRLAAALRAAIRDVQPTAAICAVAGAGDVRTVEAIGAGLRMRGFTFPITLVGDVLAAAAAGLADGPGVLIWSGTGSFAVARDPQGELHRTGGRGFLLGDQGSGYDLVRRAAAAALLAVDGLGPTTGLTDALTAAFSAPSPQRLGAVLQQLDTGQVAARLAVVVEVAAAGDPVAQEVLETGVDGLAMLANAAVRRAGLDWRELSVAIGGGVLGGVPGIADLLRQRLRSLGASATSALDDHAAARAAAWLAEGWHRRLEPQHSWVTRGAL